MNIVVCLKLVSDPDIAVFDVAKNELMDLYPVMDPIGYQVLEAGLRLREANGGRLTVVCMGGTAAETMLCQALHQGADTAIRFFNQGHKQTDTWICAKAIAKGLSAMPYDLILTGAASADTGNGYMPAALAVHLSNPFATQIVDIQKDASDRLTVVKKLSQGKRETYALDLPAIVGCATGLNKPRYVAPFSRVYRQGEKKSVQSVAIDQLPERTVPLTHTIKITESKPRVKAGINITALSMADRLKMMRGELGIKKEVYIGSANEGARRIIRHGKLDEG